MESPRLRLIYLAALRGFLKPGYRLGIQSYIREELLSRALVREMEGETFTARGLVEAAMLQVAVPNKRQDVYRNAVSYVLQGHAVREMTPYKKLQNVHLKNKDDKSLRESAAAFKVLKHTNFYDTMASILAEN